MEEKHLNLNCDNKNLLLIYNIFIFIINEL
jgi:hypothetical protein